MNTAMLKMHCPAATRADDRPGWIPPEITENWDTDTYAYQTETEIL